MDNQADNTPGENDRHVSPAPHEAKAAHRDYEYHLGVDFPIYREYGLRVQCVGDNKSACAPEADCHSSHESVHQAHR